MLLLKELACGLNLNYMFSVMYFIPPISELFMTFKQFTLKYTRLFYLQIIRHVNYFNAVRFLNKYFNSQ